VGYKIHDPSFHKKYMESGVITFVAYCTQNRSKLRGVDVLRVIFAYCVTGIVEVKFMRY